MSGSALPLSSGSSRAVRISQTVLITSPNSNAREQPDDSGSAEPDIEEDAASGGWTLAIVRLIAGISILTIGSRVLVSGATAAATYLGVSEAVIGLTIVSAGTSMPELITSLVAALRGRTDLAIGNVVGSCLLNLLLVLGAGALAAAGRGLDVSPELIQDDLPVMLLTSLACMPIFWTRGWHFSPPIHSQTPLAS